MGSNQTCLISKPDLVHRRPGSPVGSLERVLHAVTALFVLLSQAKELCAHALTGANFNMFLCGWQHGFCKFKLLMGQAVEWCNFSVLKKKVIRILNERCFSN